VRWGPLTVGDIRNAEVLQAAFDQYKPLAAMNFAGLIAVGESVQRPDLYYSVNVCGVVTLLDAMKTAGCPHLVFSSSASVYGDPVQTPMPEHHRKDPLNPYAFSKYSSERIIADYARAFDLRAMSLRYFNASGADPEGEIGETHDPETHLIPLALRAALDPDHTLTVFGTDYDTKDGSAVRDYIHVTDLADAHVRALDRLIHDGLTVAPGDALNIGTGTGFSVLEIVDHIDRLVGQPVKTTIGPRREGDPSSLVADPAQARKVLNWTPQHSDIETIIRTAATWESRRLGILEGAAPRPTRRLLGAVEPAPVMPAFGDHSSDGQILPN